MLPRPDFAAHRQAVLDALPSDEAVLVFGAPTHLRNGDAEYRYRPDSDLWWLTGWPQAECAVFLRHGEEPFVMFVQPRDPTAETWTGRRPGPEGALARYDADAAFPMEALAEELTTRLQGLNALHYAMGFDAEHDALVHQAIYKAGRAARRSGLDVPRTFHSPARLLHELRLRKQPDELAVMRAAAELSAQAHIAAMRVGAPGRHEHEVEAALEHTLRSQGSQGVGYTSIVAAGDNATILHYIVNDDVIEDGELVLVDAGGEVSFYTADITRTWPANGRFTEVQAEVYQHVLDAQLAAIDACRPGRTFMDVHDAAVQRLTEAMVSLGLLEGDVDELIAAKAFKKYYMHGTSHWLGLDVHDVGAYAHSGRSRVLEPGMVLTVEPGLYVPLDDEEAPEALRGLGIRIEDDVHVTDGDPEVLTAAVPKTIPELQRLCDRGGAA